jgi:hypothetical protein
MTVFSLAQPYGTLYNLDSDHLPFVIDRFRLSVRKVMMIYGYAVHTNSLQVNQKDHHWDILLLLIMVSIIKPDC